MCAYIHTHTRTDLEVLPEADLSEKEKLSTDTTPLGQSIAPLNESSQVSLDNKTPEEFVLSFKDDSSSDSEPDGVLSGEDEPSGDVPINQTELNNEDSPGMITSETTITVS